MFDPQSVQVAVALMKKEQELALTWNGIWQAFVMPMTKIDSGPLGDTAEKAALRAAAEVLNYPVRLVDGQAGQAMRTLQLSNRDGEVKDYQLTVVPVELHPDFAAASLSGRAVCFANIRQLQAGEYQPLSSSVKPILDACLEWGWL